MRAGRPEPGAGRGLLARCAGAAATTGLLVAGCGGSAQPAGQSPAGQPAAQSGSQPAALSCGTTRTAAAVPVHVEVQQGSVSCATAMGIEQAYNRQIAAGKVRGNGGGAPVSVHGWTCRGFTTPVVLKTGQASECVEGGSKILAVLPAPS